jgi:hypothetical protein
LKKFHELDYRQISISIITYGELFFRKYVKLEKAVQDDLSRSSSKPLYKVQEDVVALRQLSLSP